MGAFNLTTDDFALLKTSYIGRSGNKMDVFFGRDKGGYYNIVWNADNDTITLESFPSYTASSIEGRYPSYKSVSAVELLDAVNALQDMIN